MISGSLSTRLEELVGFRNLLVHQYGRVDDSRAYSYLKIESKDFYEFIETIDKYIEIKYRKTPPSAAPHRGLGSQPQRRTDGADQM